MVSNPFKEERDCRKQIDNILATLTKGKVDSIEYKLLVRQCLINFAVSRSMVENFIKEFYVDTGEIKLDDNILKKGDSDVRDNSGIENK